MKRIHYGAWATASMAALLLMASGCGSKASPTPLTDNQNPKSGTQVGNIAPEIEGSDLDGKDFKLSDYRGKVVMLDFWAGW